MKKFLYNNSSLAVSGKILYSISKHEQEDIVNMGDFDALDELEREPTEEEIRADRAANVREYFRTKKTGEDFRPAVRKKSFTVKIPADEIEMFNDLKSLFEEKLSTAGEPVANTIGYLLPKNAFDW